jgi:hypothetical protein
LVELLFLSFFLSFFGCFLLVLPLLLLLLLPPPLPLPLPVAVVYFHYDIASANTPPPHLTAFCVLPVSPCGLSSMDLSCNLNTAPLGYVTWHARLLVCLPAIPKWLTTSIYEYTGVQYVRKVAVHL